MHENLIVKAKLPKNVFVVGGGPAGMEAARTAALSGHRVVLAEALPRLGGSIAIAARAPKSRQIGDITDWLERQIYKLGVDVRTACYIELQEILDESADTVILATGSTPRMDGVQALTPGQPARGIEAPHVRSSHDLFDVPRAALGLTALVLDDLGSYEAIGVAEYLIEFGLAVTFVTPLNSFAPQMEFPQRSGAALARLRQGDFTLVTRARLSCITPSSCEVVYIDGDKSITVLADTVVLVSANRSNTQLSDALQLLSDPQRPTDVRIVGDALAPRDLLVAIREGHMAGRTIDSTGIRRSAYL